MSEIRVYNPKSKIEKVVSRGTTIKTEGGHSFPSINVITYRHGLLLKTKLKQQTVDEWDKEYKLYEPLLTGVGN